MVFSPNHLSALGRADLRSTGFVIGVAALVLLVSLAPAASALVLVTDLGTLGGFHASALGINNLGQVVGSAQTASDESHAFLWYDGRMIDINVFDSRDSVAFSINDLGQVVGWARTPSDLFHAFLWEHGQVTDLNPETATQSIAYDINVAGQVAGGVFELYWRAVTWSGGEMIPLTPPGISSSAAAINDQGQIVGVFSPGDGFTHGFLWEDGILRDLGTFGGYAVVPRDINNLGQVVGYYVPMSLGSRSFLWDDGTVTDLGIGVEGELGYAAAINDAGEVAGLMTVCEGKVCYTHAGLWEAGDVVDLGTLGGTYSESRDINEFGEIVGLSYDSTNLLVRAALWKVTTGSDVSGPLVVAVEDLVERGAFGEAQGRALLSSLGAVARQVDQDNACGAIRLLDAFIRQVGAFETAGFLASGDALALSDEAHAAIDSLSSSC